MVSRPDPAGDHEPDPGADSLGGADAELRPMRADAIRNRRRILDAAAVTFAEKGLAVPVDVVAERAGVGVGTLYRHFPTKEALFEAIVVSRIEELIDACEAEAGEPTEAFFGFLVKMADDICLKHDLFDALTAAGVDFKSRCRDKVDELQCGVDRLRERAVASGGVRDDVTIEQIIGLVMGACLAAGRPGMSALSARRMVEVICDGLRT